MSENEEKGVVCVTGGSGYIGSWLVRLLLDRGYTVHATVKHLNDEKETKHLEALEGADARLHLFQIDLLDYNSIVAAIRGVSGVFHLASPCIVDQVHDPEKELLDPAIKGTKNVLTAAKGLGVKRVVVTSSISAITPSAKWPADVVKAEDCWADLEYCTQKGLWYPVSKILAEKAAWEFSKENGLDVVVVNPGTVMGPILPPALNASMLMLLRLIQGKFSTLVQHVHVSILLSGLIITPLNGIDDGVDLVVGCTETYEDFFMGSVHVKDVALAHIMVYENPLASGRHLCVEAISHYGDFAAKVSELYPDYNIPRVPKETQPGLLRSKTGAKKLMDMGLEFIPMEQIIKDAVESLRSKGYVS
ncbi:NAD-dependent epimerase/dehydratase [Dillenia turbinata]|uniref:NAD-dependent epimerase/dehydratase n=1 Tax=Dillenia turbinata TaxID=194707 RepID=A0AAN8VTY5_9MAGN